MATSSLLGDVYGDVFGSVYGDVFAVAAVASSTGAYADYQDMVYRYDIRTLKDLVSDTGTPVSDLDDNEVLAQIMLDATGELNAAIMTGNSYTEDDMEDLLAAGGSGAAFLKRVVCQIAMALLLERRPEKYKSAEKRREEIETKILEPLRQGTRLFTVPGRSEDSSQTIKGDEINRYDVDQTRPISYRTRHYYPRREGSLPRGRL